MNANRLAPASVLTPFFPCSRGKNTTEEIVLPGAQALSVQAGQPGLRCRVLEGMLWITQEGDPTDYLVGAGDLFIATRRGRIVIESLTPLTRFVFTPAQD